MTAERTGFRSGHEPLPAYQLRRSPRARRLRVTVSPEGVQVVVPTRVPEREIRAFLDQHRTWILRKVAAMDAVLAQHPGPERLTDGGEVPLRGRRVPLRIESGTRAGPRVTIQDDAIRVRLPPGPPGVDREDEVAGLLEGSLRAEARREALNVIASHGPPNGLVPRDLRIKGQKRLWGSCSQRGMINLNWRLVLAPPPVFEYVVVHELCHLREPHHRRPFWDLVAKILPDFDARRSWLRENGPLLSLRRGG